MKKEFHIGNRKRLYEGMKEDALLVLFSGKAPRKTGDENYPFYTNRSFLYLTGLESSDFILVAEVGKAKVKETIYILPPDLLQERWNGRRLKVDEVLEQSGIDQITYVDTFDAVFHSLAGSGAFQTIYMDFDKMDSKEPDDLTYQFAQKVQKVYPYLQICDIHPQIKTLRTIKQPCEIEAMKKAQIITKEGIIAMMKASKPGMYEYQYKAEFDYALGQHGPQGSAFPSIISTGANNFCIHYFGYQGQAQDGDMILNDVGAWYDHMMCDVSRGWPCNGKFNERQRLLYTCAYNTSEYMFGIIKPGMPMADVDATIKKYNFEQLKSIGLLENFEDVGKYMWHGGAHHVGFDVHDVVDRNRPIEAGMVFCVDIGIYCEEWGIGFRLEDNCLVTEDGCINLSAETPRSIEEIEQIMNSK